MFDAIIPLDPTPFFSLKIPVGKKVSPLPDVPLLVGERPFTQVGVGADRNGITVTVGWKSPKPHCHLPDYRSGDSIELFLDTRDGKQTAYLTRFCHHFVAFPTPVSSNGDTVQSLEVTRFRTEETHDLADPDTLVVTHKGNTLHLFLPSAVLHGYDPSQFFRLGFAYRLNRSTGTPQVFASPTEDFALERHPSLWPTLELQGKGKK